MARLHLASLLASASLTLSTGCGDDARAPLLQTSDAEAARATGDASSTVREAGTRTSGGPDATVDLDAGPTLGLDASHTPSGTDASTPAGACMACAEGEVCDPVSHACVDGHRPWQLDCAHLPSGGLCQGGPREVLLATTTRGLVVMFDPQDGHYLGVFKQASQAAGSSGYHQATQGPDQCIWTVSDDESESSLRAVERWNTDGSFRDPVIPRGKYERNGFDRLELSRAITFSDRHVFVASGEHYESRTHISRYLLDGTFDAEVGTKDVRSMLYTADGSLLTAGEDKLLRWPADGSAPTTVLSENTQQLWYAGNGELITTELLTSEFYRVSIATGVASSFKGVGSSDNVSGLAALKNGRWLFTSDDRLGLMSLDPQAPGAAKPALLFSLQGSLQAYRGYFQQIGRACLPTEVVDNQPAPEPPVPPERCDEVPAGAALLSEDFEQGAFSGTGTMRAYHGWTETTVYKPLTELDASEHVGGARSLRVSAKATNEQYEVSGVAHLFPNIKPSYIGYWVKGGGGGDHDDGAELRLQGTGHLDGVYLNGKGINTHESTVALAVDAGTWARIQLRDIDWTRRSYDLYVNCMRVADDIQFEPEAGDSLSRIDLFVGSRQSVPTDAFFDDLLIK